MRKLLVSATLIFSSAMSMAADTTLFSCTLTNGESLTVKKIGNDYAYRQGSIAFKNPAKEVLNNEYTGIDNSGSGFTGPSLEMKHNGLIYTIGVSQGRNSKAPPYVSVGIQKGDEFISTYECDIKKKILSNFETSKMKNIGIF